MTRNHSSPASATAQISPTEAIRRAMDALGSSSQVPQILDYIQEHFGITGVTEPEDGERAAPSVPRLDRGEKSDKAAVGGLAPPTRREDAALAPSPAPASASPSAPPRAAPPLPVRGDVEREGEAPEEAPDDATKKGPAKRGKPKDRPAP